MNEIEFTSHNFTGDLPANIFPIDIHITIPTETNNELFVPAFSLDESISTTNGNVRLLILGQHLEYGNDYTFQIIEFWGYFEHPGIYNTNELFLITKYIGFENKEIHIKPYQTQKYIKITLEKRSLKQSQPK